MFDLSKGELDALQEKLDQALLREKKQKKKIKEQSAKLKDFAKKAKQA